MNYLAHLFLSEDTPLAQAGSLLGDFTNNSPQRLFEKYDTRVAKGVIHHRLIDRKTDTHCAVNQSVSLLFARHRHYARIILDVCYDYFLLRNWQKFSDLSSDEFIRKSYRNLSAALDSNQPFPQKFSLFIQRCISYDLLSTYRSLDGIGMALTRMARLIPRPTLLSSAVEDIRLFHDQIEHSFLLLFPCLIDIDIRDENEQ